MDTGPLVDSFKFADVVRLWARERLTHEVIMSREIARGVVAEGLRFQSVNPNWVKSEESFRGYPYVGYVSLSGQKPVLLRASALEHLLAVTRSGIEPTMSALSEEFVDRGDFQQWLVRTGRSFPAFWYGANERAPA